MLIDQYDLEVFTPACAPETEEFFATARLMADISAVFPYLNAILPGAVFYPEANALTWDNGEHAFALHPYEISVGNVEDRQAAALVLDEVVRLINQTWERRDEITPSHAMQRRLTHMAVYRLLPQTSCGQCAEASCYIFAIKLAAGLKNLADCPPLADPQYAQNRSALEKGTC